MFYVNKNPILANELDVLEELKSQLAANGIMRFSSMKVGPKNIQVCCPIHNDGQEQKPSCGISTVTQNHGERVTPAGTVHCFTCGYNATLEEMISHCFGKDDHGRFGTEWLVKNFLTISVDSRKDIQLDLGRERQVQSKSYITEEELDTYRYFHPYMFKRRLTEEVIEKFDIGYDDRFEMKDKFGKVKGTIRAITFPVKDAEGNVLFIARRSVDSKVFHYPEGVDKPVYGVYELPEDAEEVIICESFLNALTCYVYGRPAVALLGLGTESQYKQLQKLKCRKFITAFDPDAAGQAATQRLKNRLGKNKIITTFEIPAGKDINDLTEKEFQELEEIF